MHSEVMQTAICYQVVGMDCAADAAEVEQALRSVPGIHAAKVSTATHVLQLTASDDGRSTAVRIVTALGYQLDEIRDDAPNSNVTPAYTRALWTVVLLNVGYGVVEISGGIIAGSQALKADALDFLGDGLITLLGVIATGWSLVSRARSALLQGVFLGTFGVAVIANTVYRVFVQQVPEPKLMGILGLIALAVNVVAAYVLIPHRTGDSNVRAVWLFSRNDAIGNAAVVVAAGLVAWTHSPWPDLLVGTAVAALFLHSSGSIISDARTDLAGPIHPDGH